MNTQQRSSEIFTKNMGVLYQVFGYYDKAHICSFILSLLWRKSRKLLKEIQMHYKYFFEEMRESISFKQSEFIDLISNSFFNSKTLKYLIWHIRI